MQTKELQAQLKEAVKSDDGARGLVVGNLVFLTTTIRDQSHSCEETNCLQCRPIHFTARQYLFLNAYRYNTPLEDACRQVGWTKDQAIRFLKSPKVQFMLKDWLKKDQIYKKWNTPTEVIYELNRVWEGEIEKDREQMEAAKMLFTFTKPAGIDKQTTKIEINIDPGAVQEAFRRQNAIEAQVSAA